MREQVNIPDTYHEAIRSPQSQSWKLAMEGEMETIKDREVWTLVEKPLNARILGSKWVYTIKCNNENEIIRFKARIVAQGFRQEKGIQYDQVFSPVVNFTVIRLFFSILVSGLKWYHIQMDIRCAYLYAPLSETIYMKQPVGYIDPEKPNHVCLLKKALYGLHQSGREWFQELHTVLESLNFKKFEWTNCVYSLNSDIILLFYVDDMILLGKNKDQIYKVIEMLKQKFDIKVLGKTAKLLGVNFEQTENELYIHQTDYIESVYNMFKVYHPPNVSLPISRGVILSKKDCPQTNDEMDEMRKIPYRNLIGCLAFIASRTRPDISYVVNILSQFQSNPGKVHWLALLKVLGYVYNTRYEKLNLYTDNFSINCYSDAEYASNRDDRVSIGGFIIYLNDAIISWRTCKQRNVTLSTMEAEYVSLTEAAKELMWMINIIKEGKELNIFPSNFSEFNLYCDNRAAIDFSNSPIENSRTKHIHVRYHFLRNLICEKMFKLKYVSSKENLADLFTKPPTKDGLMKLKERKRKILKD